MTKPNLHPGKIQPLAQIVARMVAKDPTLAENPERLMATLVANVPALGKKDTCPNCSASMQEYVFEFDLMDALLLVAMANEVSHRLDTKGRTGELMHFTEANQIKTTQLATTYAARSRTTQCSKLGLVAKMKGPEGRQVPGTWVITTRGWAALRGEAVPKSVRVWRGQILERPEETITIGEALRSHEAKLLDLHKRGKTSKADYRQAFSTYNPEEWVHFAGVHQGELM
jgi:hypothetical protein